MVDFGLDHVQPVIALAIKNQEYFDAARMCHEARANAQQMKDTANQYDQKTLLALDQSAMVGLMDCYEKERLRRSLLAWGVSEHDLNRIDLLARNQSETSLWYFVDGVKCEQ
jgi:hypothetical protein